MTCDPSERWTFVFDTRNQNSILKIRPVSMNLELSRLEYDFARAKFSTDVGEKMKPYTKKSNGVLNNMTRVRVYNGDHLIQNFVCRPDYIRFGTDYTHIEFHDLHEALSNGLVNIQRNSAQLINIYKDVFEQATTPFLRGIEFTEIQADQITELYSKPGLITRTKEAIQYNNAPSSEDRINAQLAKYKETKKLVDSQNAIDFENVSPEKAIQRLNKLFRLNTWVSKSGVVKVGSPATGGKVHLAAPDDERVWRYKDPSISHGREPIQKVVVVGNWVDETGWGGFEETASKIASFAGGGGESDGADALITGIAERNDIDYGDTAVLSSPGAKKEGIKEIAITELRRRMIDHYKGSVNIDPELSGEEVTKLQKVYPSDFIRLVPDDDLFHEPTYESGGINDMPDPDEICGSFVNNEQYHISGVQHELSKDGDWQIGLDIGLLPDVDVDSHIDYYDPYNNEFIGKDNFEADGFLSHPLENSTDDGYFD